MGQVAVTINGRKYQIACDDGQEAHLKRLGDYVDKRIGELVAAVGQVGDAHLLVMVSLLVADELSDAYSQLESLRAIAGDGDDEAVVALETTMQGLAERIEGLTERLKLS